MMILLLLLIKSALAQTNIPGGDVSGVWIPADSPYYINGEITIPDSTTLSIEPGVKIVFMGHYKFNVQGRLLAAGTEQDTIFFTAQDKENGWHGIRFIQTPTANDTSKLSYCSFTYGKANTGDTVSRCGGAILIKEYDKVLISHCLFKFNTASGEIYRSGGGAVMIWDASPTITNCFFSDNDALNGGAIWCAYSSEAVIKKNTVTNNHSEFGTIACSYSDNNRPILSENIISHNSSTYGGGIGLRNSRAVIINNIITNNNAGQGGGINIEVGRATFINNTIAYNSGQENVCFNFLDESVFINNIFYGPQEGCQIYLLSNYADPDFYYNDIQDGIGGFQGSGTGFYYTGYYINNIDSDPLFIDSSSNDYRLSDFSPCIGAGVVEISGFFAPPFCIYDTPRPSPPDTKPDIGACENLLGTPLVSASLVLGSPNGGEALQINSIEKIIWKSTLIEQVKIEYTTDSLSNWNTIISSIPADNGNFDWEVPDTPSQFCKIKISDTQDSTLFDISDGFFSIQPEVSVKEENQVLLYFELVQNYPNPFNPSTTIEYSVKTSDNITIKIYNSNGQLIKILVNEIKTPGEYSVLWDGKDDSGKQAASGVYFFQFYSKDFSSSRKMIFLK